jgi:hypothetical protein
LPKSEVNIHLQVYREVVLLQSAPQSTLFASFDCRHAYIEHAHEKVRVTARAGDWGMCCCCF